MAIRRSELMHANSPIGPIVAIRRSSDNRFMEAVDFILISRELNLRPLTLRELDIVAMDVPTRNELLRVAVRGYRSGSIVAYQGMGIPYEEGQWVIDAYADSDGRRFVLHPSAIPEEALGREGMIFIEKPIFIIDDNGNVVVTVNSTPPLFVQNTVPSGTVGISDSMTGLVVYDYGEAPDPLKRVFYRDMADLTRVVLVGRTIDSVTHRGRQIYVEEKPDDISGVLLTGNIDEMAAVKGTFGERIRDALRGIRE